MTSQPLKFQLVELKERRGGSMMLLSMFCLIAAIGFTALTIDIGLTRTDMQKAVDAAALAAAQEVAAAIKEAAQQGLPPSQAIAMAESQARDVAEHVADLNGVYIDKALDVEFGKRVWNPGLGEFEILWGNEPPNAVKVTARRNNPDTTAPDGELPLFFSPVGGTTQTSLHSNAIAYIEARDFVVVLDFSGSMTYDTGFKHTPPLALSNVEDNLDDYWQALRAYNPRFSNTNRVKWRNRGFGRINSHRGTFVNSTNVDTVFNTLRLHRLRNNGRPRFPFPQEGKNGIGGSMKGEPHASTSESRWKDYIEWVLDEDDVDDAGYRKWYGYRTLIAYLLSERWHNHESEDLWAIPHYPFHACKDGLSLFIDFLEDLEFGDEVGLVSYDSSSRVEDELDEADLSVSVDLGSNRITDELWKIDVIQRHKQAAHYYSSTGLGYGIKDARELMDADRRYGARPALLVMTDGNANRSPSGWSLPGWWNWTDVTDWDNDGTPNYTTSNKHKQYAMYQAKLCIDEGYLLHTMSVGSDSDGDLMEAIALSSGGVWIPTPGGATIDDLRDQLLEAFAKIAAAVPPARLAHEE